MRVLIVEDQALLREGIARLFSDAGHTVVGTLADTGALALTVASRAVDLVVMDVRMPPTFSTEGIDAARMLKTTQPGLGILMLSQHLVVRQVAELSSHGGFGYLLKDRVFDVEQFIAAAERVATGGSALDPKVVERLMGPAAAGGPLDELTERERQLVALMAEGLTNAGIAKRLVLSERTVESHVRSLFSRLDLPRGADAHRRVLAVRAFLESAPADAAPVATEPA